MSTIPKIYIFTGLSQTENTRIKLQAGILARLRNEKNIGDEIEILVDEVPREKFLASPEGVLDTWQSKRVLVLLNIRGADKDSVLNLKDLKGSSSIERVALVNPWLILFNGMEQDPQAKKKEAFHDYKDLLNLKPTIAVEAMSFRQAVDIAARNLIASGTVQEPGMISMRQV